DADAGSDSTRASAHADIRSTSFLPPPSQFSSSSRPPCPSRRSPPSRSPAIAYAAVHTHTAAHRTHADSAQSLRAIVPISPSPRLHPHPPHPPSLTLPSSFPALAYTVAPCPHRRGERRHQTRARVTQLRHGSSPRALPRLHPHPHRLSFVPRHTRPRTAASTGAGATHVHVARDRAPTCLIHTPLGIPFLPYRPSPHLLVSSIHPFPFPESIPPPHVPPHGTKLALCARAPSPAHAAALGPSFA
ncbi:hypothetical protein B0H16DRAFT_1890194, partial [Mycena metata]